MNQRLEANTNLSHYRIISKLGAGGMGEVYLAEDTRLDRKVAIKFLNEEFSRDSDKLNRFRQEAKAASALNHPNILTVHEIGEAEETSYTTTEFIEGETLRQVISRISSQYWKSSGHHLADIFEDGKMIDDTLRPYSSLPRCTE